ncbi:putative membrane protein [Winogradskyella eximia]|jgi:uncharacterized membrane protein|uniref:Putative membrane protein n=1 Tax=Winogradskyella eximia TaxID=262006 RepID=A0A3D9H4R5_9FLAO|nr:YtxH domain-containing protein [Winogradskyella eximia]RED44515.1 putative membrane protein [Winogradskyella eximia]|tara:strand:+ start:4619 stop:5104 length:486 start_codon:yes stop_codon:yes gene_type:complete
MSDDNKNLSDDLDDMIGDVKEGAKKAGDKISQKANEFSDDAKELGREAKQAASDFADDAKQVLSDGKNVAIIAHIWWIGWIIALIMNNGEKKTELGSFYIRQMLGLLLFSFLSWIPIPYFPFIIGVAGLVLWIMSLIGALSGEKKPVPIIGEQFQDWFKSL